MAKTIAIIGAGIAGLAAGCYAQMNGYRSKIFELHDLPGGLCTAWQRQGYIWESIPMMAGLMQLAYMQIGNAGFPLGGSLDFARSVERRYLELGGEVHYKAQVEKILIEGQLAEIVIDLLERWYPGIREEIEVVDVATPLSYERYTGNWLGSTCGWLLTKRTMPMNIIGVRKTVPGLENFYMCGQWVEPGGTLSLAAISARNVIKIICRKDGKPFVTRVE